MLLIDPVGSLYPCRMHNIHALIGNYVLFLQPHFRILVAMLKAVMLVIIHIILIIMTFCEYDE